MKCHSIQKKFSAYQDRELEPREQEQVRSHLLSCRTCREQFAELDRVWQSLGELEEIRPDPWFYPQLVRKIKQPRERGLLPGLQWVFPMLRTPAIASILLAVGILAGTYLGNTLARCDFFPFQLTQPTYSQEALFDSLKVFDPAPPGTLAHGYLQMVSYKENEPR
jgi:predicted anti-sigma-YlaC factor YlaD